MVRIHQGLYLVYYQGIPSTILFPITVPMDLHTSLIVPNSTYFSRLSAYHPHLDPPTRRPRFLSLTTYLQTAPCSLAYVAVSAPANMPLPNT